MTVAACLIVKNESLVIRRCLDSLRGLVQAVVIVDTGSTDDTLAVIRGLDFLAPIHLHQRPWKNFAARWNFPAPRLRANRRTMSSFNSIAPAISIPTRSRPRSRNCRPS